MNPSAEKTVPLRKSLRVRVGLLVVGAVLLVAAGFLALALGPLAERVAATDFASTSTRLEARLDLSLTPAANALEMVAGWLSDAPPRIDDLATFNRLFEPILKAQPKATSIVAGDSDGHGWMLLQLADGGWRNRLTDPAALGATASLRRPRRQRPGSRILGNPRLRPAPAQLVRSGDAWQWYPLDCALHLLHHR